MEMGFAGDVIVILRKPIDGDEPTRLYSRIIQANETGITVNYGEDEDETTYFIPFSNIRAIEKAEEEKPEPPGEQQWTQ